MCYICLRSRRGTSAARLLIVAMKRLKRLARLTRRGRAPTVADVPLLAERVSDLTDPRLWPNAVELATGLAKSPSTVRDALSNYARQSRRVGRERRYPWPVAFELSQFYSVPLPELSQWAYSFLEGAAQELGADPRDLQELYRSVLGQWERWHEAEIVVTPEMIRRLREPHRLSPDVVKAELELAAPEAMSPFAPPRTIPRALWDHARSTSA
jgi:hypothetical protein